MIIFLPVCVFIGFTFTEREKNGGSVPGAIDNLSAVSILLMIGRILKRHPELQPEDTEIRLVTFGCEEAGTRGSRAYVRAHEAELRAADAVFVNIESIYRSGNRNLHRRPQRHAAKFSGRRPRVWRRPRKPPGRPAGSRIFRSRAGGRTLCPSGRKASARPACSA